MSPAVTMYEKSTGQNSISSVPEDLKRHEKIQGYNQMRASRGAEEEIQKSADKHCETPVVLKISTSGTKEQNDGKTVLEMLEQHQHVKALQRCYQNLRTENEAVSKLNEILHDDIQQIYKEICKEQVLQGMNNWLKTSIEAMTCQTKVLRKELQRLKKEYDNENLLENLFRERLVAIDVARTENQSLKKQIQEIQRQLQLQWILNLMSKELVAEEKLLQEQNRVLARTHRTFGRFLNDESLRKKCNELRQQIDAIKEENLLMTLQIEYLNKCLSVLSDLEMNHLILQVEKDAITNQNKVLRERLSELTKQLAYEEALSRKTRELRRHKEELRKENLLVLCQINETCNRLQGERICWLVYKYEKLQKDTLSHRKDIVHGDFMRREKMLKAFTSLERHLHNLRAEKETGSQSDAVFSDIQKITEEIRKEKALHGMIDWTKSSTEAMTHHNRVMSKELQRLKTENQTQKRWGKFFGEKVVAMEAVMEETDSLKKQIEENDRQLQIRSNLKWKYEEMEAEEKSLKAQNKVMVGALGMVFARLWKDEKWRKKCDTQQLENKQASLSALRKENELTMLKIEDSYKCFGRPSVSETNYQTLRNERDMISNRNKALQNRLRQLTVRLTKEEALTRRIQELETQKEFLKRDNLSVLHQIREMHSRLQGLKVCVPVYKLEKLLKDIASRKNDFLHTELRKQKKKIQKVKALQEKAAALKAEKEDLLRRQEAWTEIRGL